MIFQTLRDQVGQPTQQPGMGRHMRMQGRPWGGQRDQNPRMQMPGQQAWGHGTGAQGPAPVGAEMMRAPQMTPEMPFAPPAMNPGGGFEGGMPGGPRAMSPQGGFGLQSPFFRPQQQFPQVGMPGMPGGFRRG